ncbi:hypothetical protein HYH03_006450 [Edaphochlamys debaryana]|uniref:Ankyrin repeat domain-containing protein n=1 Tax=Edaphochlamys debaryana TaxID=47281 RepID=A0A836C141_9CHLO|nr:hypothetical protein HYH03_006450 [Edaphochlamys debaryana]|eukprot:KAG2495507.1 hypothetical protein HYH03_006450 [Edaphochlamys debaryana]
MAVHFGELHELHCPTGPSASAAAARGGHAHTLDWCLSTSAAAATADASDPTAATREAWHAALRGGHAALAERLQSDMASPYQAHSQAHSQGYSQGHSYTKAHSSTSSGAVFTARGGAGGGVAAVGRALEAAAYGCPLAVLQALWAQAEAAGWGREPGEEGERLGDWAPVVLSGAAASPTADWQAKVDWLLEAPRALPVSVAASSRAAGAPGACAERLTWLASRGFRMTDWLVAEAAAAAGHLPLLRRLVLPASQGGFGSCVSGLVPYGVAEAGQLEALQVLSSAGCSIAADVAAWHAARGCHLPSLMWLHSDLGARVDRPELAVAAARSGSSSSGSGRGGSGSGCGGVLKVLEWLRQRGCGWDERVFAAAAEGGCVHVLEWLLGQGCSVGELRGLVSAAERRGDRATAAWLAAVEGANRRGSC